MNRNVEFDIKAQADAVAALFDQRRGTEALQRLEQIRAGQPQVVQDALDGSSHRRRPGILKLWALSRPRAKSLRRRVQPGGHQRGAGPQQHVQDPHGVFWKHRFGRMPDHSSR